jgi:archaellum component FlaF (FlaF/FlaG flagellin family)
VAVLLRVDGEVVDESEVIDALGPGETRTVSFTGPACRHHMKAVVDPKDLIPETSEEDNSRSPGCV